MTNLANQIKPTGETKMTKTKLIITKADLDVNGLYAGAADVTNWQGDIEISADLGWVKFSANLRASRSIKAKAGSGIEAGEGIEAGWGIVGKWIFSGLRIFAGLCNWRIPTAEEMQIRAELRGGVIAFGEHVPPAVETGNV